MSDWSEYIVAIRDLCTALDLFNPVTFDNGHPVFMALDRTHPDMSRDDCIFVENVIGYYREQLAAKGAAPARSGQEG